MSMCQLWRYLLPGLRLENAFSKKATKSWRKNAWNSSLQNSSFLIRIWLLLSIAVLSLEYPPHDREVVLTELFCQRFSSALLGRAKQCNQLPCGHHIA